jgi:hypothetical protein
MKKLTLASSARLGIHVYAHEKEVGSYPDEDPGQPELRYGIEYGNSRGALWNIRSAVEALSEADEHIELRIHDAVADLAELTKLQRKLRKELQEARYREGDETETIVPSSRKDAQ